MARGVVFSVISWLVFSVLCLFGIFEADAQLKYTLCDVDGCNCTSKTTWINVSCSLRGTQEVKLESGHVPKEVSEIFISGGQYLSFGYKTFNSLPGLALLHIEGTKKIALDKKSFYNLTYPSLLIKIRNCEEIDIKTGSFADMQSSLSTEISEINFVSIEQEAFSKLYESTFKNIGKIALAKRTFKFTHQGTTVRHGPVTSVKFVNVSTATLPQEVFYSVLAEVSFQHCHIGEVETEAFKSTQISAVTMIDTTVGVIKERAFTGKTLIGTFRISKCNIDRIQSKAIMAAMTTMTVNHSTITVIEPGAIVSTVAKVEMIGNQISNFQTAGVVFNNWNKISIEDNIIKTLRSNFVEAPTNSETELFSFKGNEIYNADANSLSFFSQLREDTVLRFDDNFFNVSCDCAMEEWTEKVTNSSGNSAVILDSSFCAVNELLSKCFSLPVGIINMRNFTEKACLNQTICEPYNGETRTVDTTSKIFLETDDQEKQSWLILIIVVVGLFIISLLVTFVVLLVRGSRWLKRKGYFRNIHYNHNDQSNEEEENTIVTMDESNEKLEMPEELTVEFLHVLSQRLDDPSTHQEASEMIERLYEMFVVEDSYENNNRQEEEAHLYEELGNLNLQIPPPPYEEEKPQHSTTGPRGILKLMEEKFNTTQNTEDQNKPALVVNYSEPTDAAVHFYSELKENKGESNQDSMKSNGSSRMALRPLPSKPDVGLFEAGPSSKP